MRSPPLAKVALTEEPSTAKCACILGSVHQDSSNVVVFMLVFRMQYLLKGKLKERDKDRKMTLRQSDLTHCNETEISFPGIHLRYQIPVLILSR